nr:hypothetical protein Iba_chr03aCG10600 [Ipomoea batatas]GMC72245.1 hypothetical protein Iba_chr03bCG9760 [Ipomoea batatas]
MLQARLDRRHQCWHQDPGSNNIYFLCISNPSHIFWGATGEKYGRNYNCSPDSCINSALWSDPLYFRRTATLDFRSS